MTSGVAAGLRSGTRLHFMAFAARSGSTLVAKTLSQCTPGLLVVPEFRTAEFLLARSEHRVRALRARDLARILAADRQLEPNLGVDAGERGALARRLAGAGTAEILDGIISAYVDGAAAPKDVVIKLGPAAEFFHRLREVSPEGSVLHVYRDGRATVSSLLRTPRAHFDGETMGRGDVAHCCGLWVRHQRTIRRAALSSYPVHHVRYEAFLLDPPATCAALAQAMGITKVSAGCEPPFSVSPCEAGMHMLVDSPPAAERRDAWSSELSREAQVFATWRMSRELGALGYSRRPEPSARWTEVVGSVLHVYSRHLRLLARYTGGRLWRYALQPGVVSEHLNARAVAFLNRRRG